METQDGCAHIWAQKRLESQLVLYNVSKQLSHFANAQGHFLLVLV